ncbi:hypothetical protein ACFVYR_36225 [Streptomyces sp. NPDC058284]|uniref:hypothetical protein n=1 Tax=unclassified Streptomyces TaxID=2593676 RepID=UPI0036677455
MTPPPRTVAARAAGAVAAVLLGGFAVLYPSGAVADEPVTLSRTGQVTDRTDPLGDHECAVERALDRLHDDRGAQLFVVCAHDFTGRSAQRWAYATAMGDDARLSAAHLSDAQLRDVVTHYRSMLADAPVPSPSITPGSADPGGMSGKGGRNGAGGAGGAGGSMNGDLVLPVAVACAAGIAAAVTCKRRRKRVATRTTPGGGRGQRAGGDTGGPGPGPGLVPLPELDEEARLLLVETEAAVRTGAEDLGSAVARFGEEAVRPFGEALAYAQAELAAAFRLRQKLDDAFPEDDPTRRRMLGEIAARCTDAGHRLDAASAGLDRLRALEKNAPQTEGATRRWRGRRPPGSRTG